MPETAQHWIRSLTDRRAVADGCYLDEAAGQFVCDFIEAFCRQSKGRWGGQPLQLLDWQRDFLMRLFGWRGPEGKRRFKRAYLEVAKKNGKSTLVSALTLFFLVADGEPAPEVYVNACDRDQASIVFDEAARMVEASPELSKRLDVIPSKKRITCPHNHGRLQANSADIPSKDGVNASHWIFDELHRQKTREMYDVFRYAGASREQPLELTITTAGEDTSGIWHELRDYSDKVNAGVILDTSHLGVVYRALEDDDLDDSATWRKANPSLGATITEEDFARELAEAREVPARLANFKRLRLNLVVRGDQAFVTPEQWRGCETATPIARNAPVWMGCDLSSLDDLCALAVVSGDEHDGFDVAVRFWLPEDNIVELERKHQVPYREWAEAGHIELTPGNVVDYSFIRREIVALSAEYDVRKVLFDPYNAAKLALELREQDGLPVEFLRQGFLSLSNPTKQLLRLVLAGKLRHGGHPILAWHAANAIAEQDAAGNIKLSKRRSRKKIDGMAALVNAIAAATEGPSDSASVYESRGILTV